MTSESLKKILTCFECLIANSSWLSPIKTLLCYFVEIGQRVEIFFIKGQVRNTQHVLKTSFAGTREHAYQFAHLLYSDIEEFWPVKRFLSCLIKPSSIASPAQLVVVCKEKPFASQFLKRGFLLAPSVTFTLVLDQSMDKIAQKLSRRRRRDIKKIRESGYSYTVSKKNNEDLDLFYWKMYLPYTKNRFGKSAFLKTYLGMSTLYRRKGAIIFVKEKERPIAGILFQIRGKKVYAMSLGIDEEKDGNLKGLAGQAALYFLIEWAINNRLRVLDYGVTLPFLRDGLLQYKKEWGMSVEEKPDQIFWALKPNSLDFGSLSFFEQNPFIFLDRGILKAVVFVNHKPTWAELHEIFARFLFPKIESLIVISYFVPSNAATKSNEFPTIADTIPNPAIGPLWNICESLLSRGSDVVIFIRSTYHTKIAMRVLKAGQGATQNQKCIRN